jgi:hypothetical protein
MRVPVVLCGRKREGKKRDHAIATRESLTGASIGSGPFSAQGGRSKDSVADLPSRAQPARDMGDCLEI